MITTSTTSIIRMRASSCPTFILKHFHPTQLEAFDELEYCAPYNALLNHLFPPADNFLVLPLFKTPDQTQSIEFPTIFVVEHNKHPVFLLQIKPARHIENRLERRAADKQMRNLYRALTSRLTIPTLHGVSALGTQLAFYNFKKDTECLEPDEVLSGAKFLTDTAPKSRWSTNLCMSSDYGNLEAVVMDVKAMCLPRPKKRLFSR